MIPASTNDHVHRRRRRSLRDETMAALCATVARRFWCASSTGLMKRQKRKIRTPFHFVRDDGPGRSAPVGTRNFSSTRDVQKTARLRPAVRDGGDAKWLEATGLRDAPGGQENQTFRRSPTFIVLNKTDLVSKADAAEVRARDPGPSNPYANWHRTSVPRSRCRTC